MVAGERFISQPLKQQLLCSERAVFAGIDAGLLCAGLGAQRSERAPAAEGSPGAAFPGGGDRRPPERDPAPRSRPARRWARALRGALPRERLCGREPAATFPCEAASNSLWH